MINFDDYLNTHLKNDTNAAYFLKAALEDYHENKNMAFLLTALRTLISTRGKFSDVAKKAGISRQHLYKILSSKGDPKMSSFMKLLSALDLTISIQKLHHSR